MSIQKQASCNDEAEPELLPVADAMQRLLDLVEPVSDTEELAIRDCLNRVLAVDVISPIDVPPNTNSAMDGYAVHADDIPASGERSLQVVGVAWAGRPYTETVSPGQAVRIMTGAVMPAGCDTVVIQEHVGQQENAILIDGETRPGANVRQAGEDVCAGEALLQQGEILTPAHIGMLASLGIARVRVTRKLRVAFFSTGDELKSLTDAGPNTLADGEIFDSNRYSLFAMLKRLGVEIIDLGVIQDKRQLIQEAFEQASSLADVVITSGGVSVGDADFVSEVLHDIGEVTFWKLAMRPGRPLACGKVGNARFFGLPGNPVAVMVVFYEFVQPALRRMMGCNDVEPARFRVRCSSDLRKSSGRTEYQRGILYRNEQGETVVKSTGKQGAGRLSSMCSANCIIVIDPGRGSVQVGDWVEVQPFHGLV